MKCPFCTKKAQWCENKEVYGRNYGRSYMIYLCKDCDAYVGCHRNSRKPFGTMANAELRRWRNEAHAHIDPMWKSGKIERKALYRLLDKFFGKEFHVGGSTIDECKKVLTFTIDNPTD